MARSVGAAPRRSATADYERPPSALAILGTVALVVAGLYLGREIFVPFALAILLSFVLAPIAGFLRGWRLGRITSVIITVLLAFLVIFAIGAVIAGQVASLAENLPQYQSTLTAKIQSLRGAAGSSSMVERASSMLRDLGEEISRTAERSDPPPPARPGAGLQVGTERPVPVQIQQPDPTPFQVIQSVIGPLLEPLATTGIVIVFVIFILLQREDLRDRVIRLAGVHDLQRTTQALDDAAKGVSRYLLMQTVVNATYGLPVGLGLWFIGVPNAVLWGVLAMLLRFVPYIGPWIAALFPLALCLAVDEGWSMLLWTIGLFVVLELISNNVVEPWLYGSSTGLSELAVIAAAVFWTWLWGPIGLLLATPLTSCMVVLGRHVPQLQFLDILLGNKPVLSPAESFYQRMLAGDPDEAAEQAEEMLKERPLSTYYDDVAVPALGLAQRDAERGTLDDTRQARIKETVETLVDDLAEHEDALPRTPDAGKDGASVTPLPAAAALPARWRGKPVVCAAARGELDEAAAMILAQLVEKHGIGALVAPSASLSPTQLSRFEADNVQLVFLSYLDATATTHARYLVRRLRRRVPGATIVVCFWGMDDEEATRRDPLAATGADAVVRSMQQAVKLVRDAAHAPPRTSTEAPAAEHEMP